MEIKIDYSVQCSAGDIITCYHDNVVDACRAFQCLLSQGFGYIDMCYLSDI